MKVTLFRDHSPSFLSSLNIILTYTVKQYRNNANTYLHSTKKVRDKKQNVHWDKNLVNEN